ncbi:MAG: type II toxin-antitoxin system RelB/DinJ family antitoxin [archaeon]
MASTTIQIRIDSKIKKEARKLFDSLGIDISSAVKMFLVRSIKTQTLAIKGLTDNGFTPAREREMIKEAEWAQKHGKRYTSVKKMLDDILEQSK